MVTLLMLFFCCVISGKSTVACALSRGLHARRKLTYILDGDNVRHGLSSDLSFGAEDRTENIRRVGRFLTWSCLCVRVGVCLFFLFYYYYYSL